MRRDDAKVRSAAKRLIRAGVPLDVPGGNSTPPLIVKQIEDYDVCEISETNSGDTAVIANVQVTFMRTTFLEEVSVEFPWRAEVDNWLEPNRNPKNGHPDYGFSAGQRYPTTMVLNGCLSGRITAGTVMKGLLLGISYTPIPENLKGDDSVTASLKICCAPDAVVSQPLRMRVGQRVPRERPASAPRQREPLFGADDGA